MSESSKKTKNEVIALLAKAGKIGLTAKEVREALDLKNSTAYAYLDSLIKSGDVFKGEKIDEGYLYALHPATLEKYALAQNDKAPEKEEKPIEIKEESALEQKPTLGPKSTGIISNVKAVVRHEAPKDSVFAVEGFNKSDIGKHYRFVFRGLKVDPYRIFRIYKITYPEQQHAIKKLLRAGNGHKSLLQDIEETIATLQRWKEIIAEDQFITDTL